VYVGQNGGVNVGYGGQGIVGVSPGGDVRVGNVPSRIANLYAQHQVQQPTPYLQYHPPQTSRVGVVGRLLGRGSHVTTPGYYSQPYTWYEYKYFPVANSTLYAPSNMYPYGYTYDPASSVVDYYTPPYDIPADARLAAFTGDAAGAAGAAARDEASPVERGTATVRTSNAESRRKAGLLAEAGDAFFRKQRFHEALQQYKTAARIAPDVADYYLRQGHALVATKRYDLAAEAFKRGLAIDPAVAMSALRLDTLYHDSRLAKHSHLDMLAATALGSPDDADLLFVLGVFLHFDGQADRARKFLERSAALSTGHGDYVRPFLEVGRAPLPIDATAGTRT
jgi:tetratricopeptide (TPR) repeat protein